MMRRSLASPSASTLWMRGRTGQKVSKLLARSHWPSLNWRRGFSAFKFKAAFADPPELVPSGDKPGVEHDDDVVASAKAMTAAGGPALEITIDPNCGFYDAARSLELASAREGLNVMLEDPFSWQGELVDYAELRRHSPVPIAIPHPLGRGDGG